MNKQQSDKERIASLEAKFGRVSTDGSNVDLLFGLERIVKELKAKLKASEEARAGLEAQLTLVMPHGMNIKGAAPLLEEIRREARAGAFSDAADEMLKYDSDSKIGDIKRYLRANATLLRDIEVGIG